MIRWEFFGVLVLLCGIEKGESAELKSFSMLLVAEDNLLHPIATSKKKNYKKKSHKHKKTKHKKRFYSAANTEKLLENYAREGKCNRLNCSSNIKTAQSCLKTKSLRQKHKKCFRAFCKYECNEEDYRSNQEVHDFCKATCSSKKYRKSMETR